MIVNSNRFQIHCLAYNLFNWFRRLALPQSMRKMQVDTIRLKLIKSQRELLTRHASSGSGYAVIPHIRTSSE
jgi:hypothetical protein